MLEAIEKTGDKVIQDKIKALFVPIPAILIDPPSSSGTPPESKSKINILFLDVDGVLNSHKIQILTGNLAFPDPDSPGTNYVSNKLSTDIMAAKLINKVCKATNTFIVLSSSWRIGTELHMLKPMLGELGIDPNLVIGKTDTLNSLRGDQILRFWGNLKTPTGREYLVTNDLLLPEFNFPEICLGTYAIVDDNNDESFDFNHKGHFVQTSFMDGLTCELTLELGKILSEDETFYLNRLDGRESVGHTWEKGFH